MPFILGFVAGLLLTWLTEALQRRLCGKRTDSHVAVVSRKRRREERQRWEQTRNFLRYDGTVMPKIMSYKEDIYE